MGPFEVISIVGIHNRTRVTYEPLINGATISSTCFVSRLANHSVIVPGLRMQLLFAGPISARHCRGHPTPVSPVDSVAQLGFSFSSVSLFSNCRSWKHQLSPSAAAPNWPRTLGVACDLSICPCLSRQLQTSLMAKTA